MKKLMSTLFIVLVTIAATAQDYRLGTTTAIWKSPIAANFIRAKAAGIEYVEVAMNQCWRGVPEQEVRPRIEAMKAAIDSAQIDVWSVHLPFSRTLDISVVDDTLRAQNLKLMAEMIEGCSIFRPQRLVLHPSSEPIADSLREERIANAISSIAFLKPYADKIGAQLCIENLPRTCLGNTPEELMRIVSQTPDIGICFDTNHYTKGTMGHFLDVAGSRIATIHASDFDGMNECHWLPMQGIIDWSTFVKRLQESGYQGVFMYEATKNSDKTPLTSENIVTSFSKFIK